MCRCNARLSDETTILRFRHLLMRDGLAMDMLRLVNDLLMAEGLVLHTRRAMDAALIAALSSTTNADGERDTEMEQKTKRNNLWRRVRRADPLIQLLYTRGSRRSCNFALNRP